MSGTNDAAGSESTVKSDVGGNTRATAHTFDQFAEVLRANMPRENADDDSDEGETRGESGGDGEEPEVGKAKAKAKKPKNLKAVAETLGCAVEDLYALEIPSSRQGEKPFTLGTLKDIAAQQDEFSVRTVELDADRRSFERERVTAANELREMMSALPEDALKPDALKKLRTGLAKKREQEIAKIAEVIPEWNDEAVRLQDLKGMVSFLKDNYSLPETTLMEHFDHRFMRFVRDAMRLQNAVDKALSAVKKQRGTTPPKGQRPGQEPRHKSQPNGSDGQQPRQVRGFMDSIAAAAAKTTQ